MKPFKFSAMAMAKAIRTIRTSYYSVTFSNYFHGPPKLDRPMEHVELEIVLGNPRKNAAKLLLAIARPPVDTIAGCSIVIS